MEQEAFVGVVPAYPYEGALYWMFEETRSDPHSMLSNDYYESLFGIESTEKSFRSRAAAAISLFDQVYLSGADTLIPGGLSPARVAVADFDPSDWRAKRENFIPTISDIEPFVSFRTQYRKIFKNELSFTLFADRALSQLGLANSKKSIILGGQVFSDFCRCLGQLSTEIDMLRTEIPSIEFGNIFNPENLDVYGINFSPPDYEAFLSVRSDDAIRKYSSKFCNTLINPSNPENREVEFVNAIKEALDHESLSKKTAGILETTGSALGPVSLVPIIGTASGVGAIATDMSARRFRNIESRSRWPLVGTRMQEVATKDFLSRIPKK